MNETPAQSLRTRMRTDLRRAMKARDAAAVAALRTALAGIDNAEAVVSSESTTAAPTTLIIPPRLAWRQTGLRPRVRALATAPEPRCFISPVALLG